MAIDVDGWRDVNAGQRTLCKKNVTVGGANSYREQTNFEAANIRVLVCLFLLSQYILPATAGQRQLLVGK